jgi:hypothetical protein
VDPPPWHLHHCQGTLKKANWNKNLYTSFWSNILLGII